MAEVKAQWGGQKGNFQEVVAPWFLFLTTFRRNAASMDVTDSWVREKLNVMLGEMESALEKDPNLKLTLEESKYPLVCFADEVLLTSGWSQEGAWERSLLEVDVFRTQNAGQEFFRRLEDPELKNRDVIEVYYKCLCLGFGGQYMDQPLRLREERERLLAKLDKEKRGGPRFCPKAYENTDRRDFAKLPMVATARIGIAAVALVVLILWGSGMVIESTLEDVDTDLTKIKKANSTFKKSSSWKKRFKITKPDKGGKGQPSGGNDGK